MAIGIPGVDENGFDDLYDGDKELYVSVLHSFLDKTPSVLSKLAKVSNDTLPDYATTVHGLKGALAAVCAEEHRKAALELEKFSRSGNLAGVQAKNGAFLKSVEELLENIQQWFKRH
ncbi:MAG: Hpt domain-containing protein [Treponema sp.]|jgi:HPt (histidine-containing phosphotransfer) domain-containing protein|nr:Hpt domain-containing protein [Treponema sp.]